MKGEMKISPDKERISPIMYQGLEDDFKKNNLKNRRLAKTDDFLTADGSYRSSKTEYVPRISWSNLIGLLFVHIGGLYGFYLIFVEAKLSTILWMFITTYTTGFGITAGVHRLWSHRAYKAKWPLRLLLIFLFTITGQKDVYRWALDHRVHHKYSETDADPHNVKRGFFFAHVGWLFITPHPDVVSKRKAVDMSDLEADQLVMWQKRYYILLFPLLTIGFPVVVPWYFWSESIWTSFWVNFNCRFCITLNIAFFVNSVAHMWGKRPYDKYISSVENTMLSIAALGEGWHNFHHVFPWDYKTGELGNYTFNLTTGFIDTFARFGWAYDRKYVSPAMVRRRAKRSGDGSHIWGYGDADISAEDLQELELMDKIKQIMNERKQKVKWIAILWYIYIHVLGVYAIWLMFTSAKWMTIFYTIFITAIGYFGMTAGAHRLWAHRTYESESLVKLFLMLAHTSTGVGSIYNWVLYHRIHHKYYGTDKDPYNHKKGFLYSHYLSNILSPNMNLEEMKRRIDLSDIENDIYVYFQKIFYWPLFLIFGLILPLNAPLEYWNESLIETILITGFLRFAIIINISWLMNSAFLVWNIKEGEKIPSKTISIFFLKKSFWPKYHYKIPWDWKCGEFGIYDDDWTTFFIKIAHELNLVNSLLTVDTEDIRDMLHEMTIKEITLEDSLEKLKEKSIFNMEKTKLIKKH